MKYEYPKCRKSDLIEDHFGIPLAAPYTWLRDKDDPEVLDYTARQNAFTDSWFSKEEIEAMKAELKAAYKPELPRGLSPWKDGFLASVSHEGNYSIVQLDRNLKTIKTLFRRYDLPERTPFHAEACPLDDNILAIMAQIDAAPRPDNIIYDYEKQEILCILPITFSGVWSKNRKAFYSPTTTVSEDKTQTTIQRWDGEANTVTDILTYPGNSIFGNTAVSEDGKMFIFSFSMNYSEDVFYAYEEETGKLTVLNENEPMELKYIDSMNGNHYFISLKGNDHGSMIAVPFGKTIAEAETVYTEKTAYLKEGFSINGRIFLQAEETAASKLIDPQNGKEVPLPDPVGSLSMTGKDGTCKLFSFETFTERPKILSFDGSSFETKLGEDQAHDDIAVDLLFADSKEDGEKIPYYLVHLKDAENDGQRPALMYGYGGYNISMPPWSAEMVSGTDIAAWVRNDGIYVHCLLRGGAEYGPAWHDAGMGMKKKNCYYDFIGIAEKVMQDGWTCPAKTAISGCSNGGLLMSTLVTMRPDLWGCVIDSVPHTDMIHFAKDDRGAMYVTEYGDPYHSKEEFEYLLSYSPVHNVRPAAYPPVYIQTGECDNNVPPYHGKSFAAMMQENNTSDNPVLLRVLKYGSHDRGQGEVYWQTISEMHVFMKKALKL